MVETTPCLSSRGGSEIHGDLPNVNNRLLQNRDNFIQEEAMAERFPFLTLAMSFPPRAWWPSRFCPKSSWSSRAIAFFSFSWTSRSLDERIWSSFWDFLRFSSALLRSVISRKSLKMFLAFIKEFGPSIHQGKKRAIFFQVNWLCLDSPFFMISLWNCLKRWFDRCEQYPFRTSSPLLREKTMHFTGLWISLYNMTFEIKDNKSIGSWMEISLYWAAASF